MKRNLTYDEFMSQYGDKVDSMWLQIHDEYGDAAPLLGIYRTQVWQEFNNGERDESLRF